YLLEHRERLVTKDELIEKIWEGAAVTDNALAQCIVDIRKALGDDSRRPRFIKTIPKAGYRFISEVEERWANGGGTIETEEITSVSIMYEESFAQMVPDPQEKGARRLPSITRLFAYPRMRIAAALVIGLVVILAVVLLIYPGSLLRPTSEQRAEVIVPAVPGRKPVVVMYFDNQSRSKELDWLREGLADMIISNLSRSDKLTVLSRQQLNMLLERMGYGPKGEIRLDKALEVAGKSQAEKIILGSFAGLGEKIRIDVRLHDAATGRLLAVESMTVDRPEQILTQIDLLSLKLATHMGATPANRDAAPGIASVMTKNLEAYRCYSLAIEKANAYHSREALALLEKAIALDPEFAMAYARIGYVYTVIWNNERARARPYLEKAFQLQDRLTERDRLYIAAWYAMAHQDNTGAIEAFRKLISRYPYEIEAYLRLGNLLNGQTRAEEAVAALQQALVVDPEARDVHNALGFFYWRFGRYDDAIAAHQKYVLLSPDEANAHDSLGLSYIEAGRYEGALASFGKALALKPDFHFALLHVGDVRFGLGQYHSAIEEYRRYLQVAPSDWDRAVGHNRLVLLYLKKGDLRRAEAAARQELKYKNDFGGSFLVALARADMQASEKLLEQLLTNSIYTEEENSSRAKNTLHYFQGLFALKSGRATEALEHFQEAMCQPGYLWNISSTEDCLANTYLELGRLDEAIAEYERILSINPNWPPAHYNLGQAYERKGERERARSSYERFLEIWKKADTDAPQFIDAGERLKNLQYGS
ncbi:MAG: tetratricopeptide repeat protein, partial [Blastocatellia bacterium]|nr:tetratricopeptide repeat protein [Blastocatellia bacterium]